MKFRNKEQYIKTHPHHLHPNQTYGMQTQIRKKKQYTMPASTATTERSFSVLRRLKTYLRTTMLQDRLTSLAVLTLRAMLVILDVTVVAVLAGMV
jgi:hypothetical protein